jgi:hypothetical protein
MECLDADIDIDLFSKTIISVVGDKHHGHPVISGVTRNLFRVTTTYNFHIVEFSCRTFIGQTNGLPRATKKRHGLTEKKGDATFHLRVFHFVSDHAVFPVATIRKKRREITSFSNREDRFVC